MKLKTYYLTNNDCYKAAQPLTPKGILVHSTGCNNPNLKRYVGPDDGILGVNAYNNHWNQPKPDGKQVCVHAFIGKDKYGEGVLVEFDEPLWYSTVDRVTVTTERKLIFRYKNGEESTVEIL